MRAFRIIPKSVVRVASLSKPALKRLTWIDWYYSHGKNISLTARHFGISRDTFYLWLKRYKRYNLKSLEFDTKTRRPRKVREMTTPLSIQKRIYDIRINDLEKSKYEIQAELADEGIIVGQSAIQKVINRNPILSNLQHKKRVRKHRNFKIARVKAAAELRDKNLGSLVQVDTKYFYLLGNKYYLFTGIDCKSRFGFIYAYATISSQSGKDFLSRLKDYFPFPIQAVNTDNGSEYLLRFHEEIESWGIPHYFTDPHCPKQNGRVERLHQTAEYEYFNYQNIYPGLELVRQHCMLFNQKYNYSRYHRAIGYQIPGRYVRILQGKQKGGQLYGI